MSRLRTPSRRRIAGQLLTLLTCVVLAACSGIPDSGPVRDVRKVTDQGNQQPPVTPDPGMTPDAIVRGFVYSAARISLAGPTPAFAAPQQYLTARAADSWQAKPSSVVILPDQFRIDPSPTDPSALTIFAPVLGTLDADHAYHPGTGGNYRVTVHLSREAGQWRISDPPAELLIRQSDFNTVFSVRTLYFLDAAHSVVVPDRRYILSGGPPANRVGTLINMLLQGPAGVLSGAADSELTGAALRTNPILDASGVTVVDLKDVSLPTTADRNALAAQLVWTLSPDVGEVAININGAPLDSKQPVYRASTVASFSPDRVPGSDVVASDPYLLDAFGDVVDLRTKSPLFGGGVRPPGIVSAAMSAATGTLAAISNVVNSDGSTGQQLLIGQPLARQPMIPALKAKALTQPSFSRSGDEVWVVQNGADRNPEIYQVSTSRTSATGGTAKGSGTASRAKVGSAELVGKGPVTALALSPDGVRVAIVAGGKLYVGAIADPGTPSKAANATPQIVDGPDAPTVRNLRELRSDLTGVGAVAFQSAKALMVVAANLPYRSIRQVNVDGSELTSVTTDSQYGDVTSMAVSVVDPTAGTPGDAAESAAAVYVTLGQPGVPGPILKLVGSLNDGKWVGADPTSPTAISVFFPN